MTRNGVFDPKEEVLELVREKIAAAARGMDEAARAAAVASSPANIAFAGETKVAALRKKAAECEKIARHWKRVEEYLVCNLE